MLMQVGEGEQGEVARRLGSLSAHWPAEKNNKRKARRQGQLKTQPPSSSRRCLLCHPFCFASKIVAATLPINTQDTSCLRRDAWDEHGASADKRDGYTASPLAEAWRFAQSTGHLSLVPPFAPARSTSLRKVECNPCGRRPHPLMLSSTGPRSQRLCHSGKPVKAYQVERLWRQRHRLYNSREGQIPSASSASRPHRSLHRDGNQASFARNPWHEPHPPISGIQTRQ